MRKLIRDKESIRLDKARQIEHLRHNALAGYLLGRFDVTPDSVHTAVTSATSINDFAKKLGKITGRDNVTDEVLALFNRYSIKKDDLNEIRKTFGLSELD